MGGKRRRNLAEARWFWELAIELRASSGLSVARFCKQEGLKESSFYSWQQRLREGRRSPQAICRRPEATPAEPQVIAEHTAHRRPRRRCARASSDAGRLVPVRVVGDSAAAATESPGTTAPSSPIVVVFPRGTQVRIAHPCDGELLRQVLGILGSLPC